MSATPPRLFDAETRARRFARIRGREAWFLHAEVANLVSERLIEVNRSFPETRIVGAAASFWAEALAGHPKLSRIRTVPEAEVLDWGEGPADLALHALWLHAANDPVGALVQTRLALKPDGLMIAALFGGRTLDALRTALAEAEAEVTGGLSPRVSPMADLRDAGALLQRAGLAMPVADAERFTVTHGDAFALMRDLRAMGETNALSARLRLRERAVLLRAAERLAERAAGPDGRIVTTFEVLFLTGWAPSEDQPRPKRPGSATARLADALGTAERPAGEKAGTPPDSTARRVAPD